MLIPMQCRCELLRCCMASECPVMWMTRTVDLWMSTGSRFGVIKDVARRISNTYYVLVLKQFSSLSHEDRSRRRRRRRRRRRPLLPLPPTPRGVQLAAWERDGYVIVRGLLSPAECARLERAVTCDGGIEEHAYGRDDGNTGARGMALWNHPGNDVTGAIARIPRVRKTMERLLGGPVYHHTKLMMKDAKRVATPLASGLWILGQQRLPVPTDGHVLHPDR